MPRRATAAAALCHLSAAQHLCSKPKAESHPPLSVNFCTKADGCIEEQMSVVIDANWRWTHAIDGGGNCYTGNEWSTSLCPNASACTDNCCVDGASSEYTGTYGVITTGNELKLKFVTGPNIGSRVYLLESEDTYHMFRLKNREFTFDVDVSQLPCGLNGAMYFVEMDDDGGMARWPNNRAGAKYGTGYCDAQCPHDIKWINGEANCDKWMPQPNDKNSGWGHYGSCCSEFDVWEANSISSAYTAHVCEVAGQTRCEGADCGDDRLGPAPGNRFNGLCDKNGCDYQPYRLGEKHFWGPGPEFVINTLQPVRVVTQFLTDTGLDSGELSEIRRFFKQGDKKVSVPPVMVGGKGPFSAITKDFCQASVDLFADKTDFLQKGGMKEAGESFDRGMVLALSLWDDHDVNMLWLDSNFPLDVDPATPGVARGSCPTSSGVPSDVENQHGNAFVRYFNIRFGELNSTDVGPAPPTSAPGSATPVPGGAPPPPTPGDCEGSGGCHICPGQNNDGHNMVSSAKIVSGPAACCAACVAEEGCRGWTYVPGSGGECWLKDEVGDLRGDGSVTSGSVDGREPCPGGSIDVCLQRCPSSPTDAFKECAAGCTEKCASGAQRRRARALATAPLDYCTCTEYRNGCSRTDAMLCEAGGGICYPTQIVHGNETCNGGWTPCMTPPPTPMPPPTPHPTRATPQPPPQTPRPPTPQPVLVPTPPPPTPVPTPAPTPAPVGCPGGSNDNCADLCPSGGAGGPCRAECAARCGAPPPPPPSCPGGSLSACMNTCPSSPASAYKDCVATCTQECE